MMSTAGQSSIDRKDVRTLKKDDLRRKLGLVLQDNFLFADTVMENIRYGRLEAGDEEVVAAAKLANADLFIHRLPQGYQTVLTERGSNLSQGQRQLLAIAARRSGRPGYPDPGRSHQQCRYPHRETPARSPAAADERSHELRHCAPPFDDPRCRPGVGGQ